MVAFGAAQRSGETLAVRRALPDVPERMSGRLSYTARLVAHQHWAQHGSGRTAESQPVPAMEVGVSTRTCHPSKRPANGTVSPTSQPAPAYG